MAIKFSNLVKTVILEQGRYELLLKTYTEPKKKGEKTKPARMSKEDFNKIISADPTTRKDGDDIKKAGKYVNWLLKQFLQIEPNIEADYGTPAFKAEKSEKLRLFFEDLYKVTQDLEKFERFKNKLDREDRDINKLSIDKLNDLMLPYSLEKTKASKDEKEEAAKTYDHPGGEVIFRGSNWTVVRISDSSQLGKDAACFYGGSDQKPGQGESGWCTSSPGGSMFNHYIKSGPLYVILPNEPEEFMSGGPKVGKVSGLPAKRFQFHFPSNQFMDANDRSIDLINFLLENPELKEVFKPEFAKGMTSLDGKKVNIDYPRDAASKYIALYGFDELFQNLPNDITSFDFTKSSGGYGYRSQDVKDLAMDIPEQLGNYKNLMAVHFEGILKSLPKSLGKLENLQFLSIPNNPNLKTIPEEIAQLPNLKVINIQGNPQLQLPEAVEKMAKEGVFISK